MNGEQLLGLIESIVKNGNGLELYWEPPAKPAVKVWNAITERPQNIDSVYGKNLQEAVSMAAVLMCERTQPKEG